MDLKTSTTNEDRWRGACLTPVPVVSTRDQAGCKVRDALETEAKFANAMGTERAGQGRTF